MNLRTRLQHDDILVAPGAVDALSARLVEEMGFEALFLSGAGVSYTLLGKPDVGLVNQMEMAQRIQSMSQAVNIPIIADGDNGHGNALNLIRTVQVFENAGASAIQIEDQVFPKRCGHMAGKEIVPAQEMVGKIKAAVSARKSKDFLIVARTDSKSIFGMDEAIRRSHQYIEAGADILFLEAPSSREELALVGRTFEGIPLMANMVEGGKTPLVSHLELQQMGYKIVIHPSSLLQSYMFAGRQVLHHLKEKGTTEGKLDQMLLFNDMNQLVKIDDIGALEDHFVYKDKPV